MAERPGIMVYFELRESLEDFSDAESGQLLKGMLEYGATGALPEYTDRAMRTLWKSVQQRIDTDAARYQHKVEQAQRAGRASAAKRSTSQQPLTSVDECQQNQPTTTQHQLNFISTSTDIGAAEPQPNQKLTDGDKKRTRFVPPTVGDVEAYCKEHGYSVNAQRFVDYYTAIGWVQGRGKPIKSWKACVNLWERRDKDGTGNNGNSGYSKPASGKAQNSGSKWGIKYSN